MEFLCPVCSQVVSSAPSEAVLTFVAKEPGPCCGGIPADKRPKARTLTKREFGAHIRRKFGRIVPAKMVR